MDQPIATIHVKAPLELIAAVKAAAERDQRTFSNFVRKVLTDHVAEIEERDNGAAA